MNRITAITVTCNTKLLIQAAYESFRKFHPDMHLIIVDGSTPTDECYKYVVSLASKVTTVAIAGYNIGHGKGMNEALYMVKTPYALIFDSDIVFLKSPVEEMLKMFEPDTYGVGYIEETGWDGFEYKVSNRVCNYPPIKYLHPYFQLISVSRYKEFPPYVHHGAPCFKTMNEISRQGLSDKILKVFPGLGHSSGKGWGWVGEPREFIQHDTAGTRNDRVRKGLHETEGAWER